MTTKMWESKKQQSQFFDELRELISRYPNLYNRMAQAYSEDPTNDMWTLDDGYPSYSPDSPMYLQGIVVVISHSNLEHWEDMKVVDPFEQSSYMTAGLLDRAAAIYYGVEH